MQCSNYDGSKTLRLGRKPKTPGWIQVESQESNFVAQQRLQTLYSMLNTVIGLKSKPLHGLGTFGKNLTIQQEKLLANLSL